MTWLHHPCVGNYSVANNRSNRHWGVFFPGTIMLMVFWIITPLQSSIFNVAVVTRSIPIHLESAGSLLPFEDQANALNSNFLNTAYGVSWLKQKSPQFTTHEIAVLPFQPTSRTYNLPFSETWSTNVEAFSTSLNCTPAKLTPQKDLTYTADNGRGCTVDGLNFQNPATESVYFTSYIGWYNDPYVDQFLANPNCSAEHSNNFLALLTSSAHYDGNRMFNNVTAIFCVPSYHVETILVTVNASDHALVRASNSTTANRAEMPLNIFNTSHFEYLLGAGISPTSLSQRVDYPDSVVLEQFSRLKDYNMSRPITNMAGFAAALSLSSIPDFQDPLVLQQAFEKAHQLLFSTAFSTLTADVPVNKTSWGGVCIDKPGAIVLVRTVSIVVEAALGVVVILTTSLWYLS